MRGVIDQRCVHHSWEKTENEDTAGIVRRNRTSPKTLLNKDAQSFRDRKDKHFTVTRREREKKGSSPFVTGAKFPSHSTRTDSY